MTTTTSTAASTGQNIVNLLGSGSGIDTKVLAQNLVDAEKAPQKALIDAALQKTQAKISGYGTVMSSLSTFKAAFAALQDQSSLNTISVQSNAAGFFEVTAGAGAAVDTHQISVVALAQSQRSITAGFSSASAQLNGGAAFTVDITVGSGATIHVTVNTTTPTGIASAINAAKAGVGAQLVNTGSAANPYKLVLTSTNTGTASAFTATTNASAEAIATPVLNIATSTFSGPAATLNGGTPLSIDISLNGATARRVTVDTTTPAGAVAAINAADIGVTATVVNTGSGTNPYKITLIPVNSGDTIASSTTAVAEAVSNPLAFSTVLQPATDAHLRVDGLDLWRNANSIDDAIDGVTLDLLATTPLDAANKNIAATVQLSTDTSSVATNIRTLVTAFNNLKSTLKTVSDPKSTVANEGATLLNDSLVRQIENQITKLVTGTSSTPGAASNGSSATALRDLGVSIKLDGTLALDNTKLTSTLNNNFAGVVKMLSANTNNTNSYSTAARGLAGDAVKALASLMSSTGPILSASSHAASQVTKYHQQESDLDTRMLAVLARYTQQFTAMDTLVGQINSLKTSLTNQFDSMLNSKNN